MADQADGGTPLQFSQVLADELRALSAERTPDVDSPANENQRLRALFAAIHSHHPQRSALCLSGGGIRSATFSLGVLQGLARAKLLPHFDYLSTVSGGGYVGGWLSAWITNTARDGNAETARQVVFDQLAEAPRAQPLDPEWPPIRFLRTYSNYLSPRLSLLSADTWTLAATFVRNMLLNWLVLIPTLLAALVVPRFFMAAALSQPGAAWETRAWWGVAILFGLSTAYTVFDSPECRAARPQAAGAEAEDQTPRQAGRETQFFWLRLVPLVVAAHVAVLGWAWRYSAQEAAAAASKVAIPSGPPRPPLVAPEWWELTLVLGIPVAVGWVLGWVASAVAGALQRRGNPAASVRPRAADSRPRGGGLLFLGCALFCAALAGWALRWATVRFFSEPTQGNQVLHLVCYGPALLLALHLLADALLVGLSSRVTSDRDREWWGRSDGWVLVAMLVVAGQSTVVYWGTFWLELLEAQVQSAGSVATWLAGLGGISGVATALLGASTKTAALARQSRRSRGAVLTAAALLFLLLLYALLAYATHRLAGGYYMLSLTPHLDRWNLFQPWKWDASVQWFMRPWLCMLIPLAIGLLMSWLINVNRFSLHTMYRNRLVRAYLGASNPRRDPHPFTGFDEADNFDLATLAPVRPLHVVNMALNLVSTDNLAWQERKAQSFTASRLHCGSWGLGYQPAATYGHGLTLGTAVTISGAAANPNMGYHSSPLVSILMTLFNVRLGWWLPNPGPEGVGAWHLNGPRWALGPLCAEALGLTNRSFRYVNLSDGGHFENLGIYEMVLRRCRHLVVVDGGQDGGYIFDDLGNAIRKVRIDMGISIDVELKYVTPKRAGEQLAYCAVGTIHYGDVDRDEAGKPAAPGQLLYIKPVLTGGEPADVANYYAAHPEFPHESTSDQFFSESQLESYRMLGCHALSQITGGEGEFGGLADFFAHVRDHAGRQSKLPWTAVARVADGAGAAVERVREKL